MTSTEPLTDAEIDEELVNDVHQVISSEDAPYGYKADGTPRKRPPTRGPEAGRVKPTAPPKRKTGTTSRGVKSKDTDYEEGVSGLLQLATLGLMASKQTRRDAVALAEHGPTVSRAVGNLAKEKPEVAAILDRFMAVGPYGALVAAVLPLGVQIAANHGILPGQVAKTMRARSPEEMDAMADQFAAQMAGQEAESE